MTLSTNSFDEFHCQAADNLDTKEENESSKYFYHKILNIWEFPRPLNDVRLCIHIRDQEDHHHHVSTHLVPGPWAKAAPILFLRTVSTCFLRLKARVAQISISRTFRLLARLHLTVDSCTQWPGVQTVAKPVPPPSPDLNFWTGAQLQTRVRRAGVKSSVSELRPHFRDKTRQKQGYLEVLRQ